MAGRALVYGGKGALGSTIVSFLRSKNWWVVSVDLFANEEADSNVLVNPEASWTSQETEILEGLSTTLSDNRLDAVLCVAGGWAGGNAAAADMVKNADLMWKQSVWSSAIAARIANLHLKDGGLLTLTGARPAREGTEGMMGYGMAKAAVHQLTKSLAADKSGMPANSTAVAILPVTLDTPMNRKFMPNADFSAWTPLQTVAETFLQWMEGNDRPASGSLLDVVTVDNQTTFTAA
ncbi:dihydropteridine reductase-like [Sycon ciliatum]|uniref:dihydropteridine reductase-like n=1 Tax=Sycon ciliatum TaxID=27933 RepID=UPI0031F6C909|eukprot:scpid4649/ scgid9353/ Dihydropteridine reductase; HDHPR; Quinoid dihydropteridine reductase